MNANQFVKQQISSNLSSCNSINLILGSESSTLPKVLDELEKNERKHLTISSDIISKSQPHDVWRTANRIRLSGRDVILVFSHIHQLEQHESAIHQFQLLSNKHSSQLSKTGNIFLLLTRTDQSDLSTLVQRSVDTMFIDTQNN